MTEETDFGQHLALRASIIGDPDNWSGVSDAGKRKRIQNRINQRSRSMLTVI
jgi:hypothetical protein